MCGLTTEDFLIALGDNQNHNFSQMQELLTSMDQRLTSVEAKMENVVTALMQLEGSMSRAKGLSSSSDQPGPSMPHKINMQKFPQSTQAAGFLMKSEDEDSSEENYEEEPEKIGSKSLRSALTNRNHHCVLFQTKSFASTAKRASLEAPATSLVISRHPCANRISASVENFSARSHRSQLTSQRTRRPPWPATVEASSDASNT